MGKKILVIGLLVFSFPNNLIKNQHNFELFNFKVVKFVKLITNFQKI